MIAKNGFLAGNHDDPDIVVAKKKEKVRFMYREMPDNEKDSGWRFFSGNESDEYANNPDNLNIYDINTIAEIDISIIPYLESSIGSIFDRENENERFVEKSILE